MPGSRRAALAAVGLWLLTVVAPAVAQQPSDQQQPTAPVPPPAPTPEEPPPPVEPPPEPAPVTTPEEPVPAPKPGVTAPPTFLGPDLFNPPPHRGWLTLTPSISIVGEYNDNLSLRERDEDDDFIVGAIPGFTLSMQRPNYRVLAGYNFTAEYYAEESENNGVAKRQQLFTDARYLFGPTVTLTLLERFIYDRESSVVTTSGLSVGRRQSMRNTLAPRLDWQATPRTSLNFSGSYTLLRFEGDDGGRDSDTYRIGVGADHDFTRRLTGTVDLGVGYFDVEDEEPAVTYTPRVGFSYQFTPTLRGSIRAGPSVRIREGETHLSPAASANMDRLFRSGSFRVGYSRAVTAETVGSADRQTAFANLRLLTPARGFVIELTPRYTHVDRDIDDSLGDDRTIDVLTVNFRVSYQIARTFSVFGAYTYYHTREDPRTREVDQNRVFFGVQYAYPINFD